MTLTELVERAVSRLKQDGIEGWGLNNPNPELFDVVTVRPASGCTNERCNHNSHDPAAPDYKLIAKRGELVYLDAEIAENETRIAYYLLMVDNKRFFYDLREPRHFWASIGQMKEDDVPEWALAKLAEPA